MKSVCGNHATTSSDGGREGSKGEGRRLTLQAVEAVDEEGERHALGNLICGALSPFLVHGSQST